jgi:hypothetical protein
MASPLPGGDSKARRSAEQVVALEAPLAFRREAGVFPNKISPGPDRKVGASCVPCGALTQKNARTRV